VAKACLPTVKPAQPIVIAAQEYALMEFAVTALAVEDAKLAI
jgi:hypothetical protein